LTVVERPVPSGCWTAVCRQPSPRSRARLSGPASISRRNAQIAGQSPAVAVRISTRLSGRGRKFGSFGGRGLPLTGIVPFGRLVEQVMTAPPYARARRVFWIVDYDSSHLGLSVVEMLDGTVYMGDYELVLSPTQTAAARRLGINVPARLERLEGCGSPTTTSPSGCRRCWSSTAACWRSRE
jgi:hypothetical protein